MNVSLETRNPADAQADVLVVGRYSNQARPTPELTALDKKLGGLLTEVLKTERFEGKAGQISHFLTGGRIAAGRVLVVGLGQKKPGDAEPVRRGASAAIRRARDLAHPPRRFSSPATGWERASARRRSSRVRDSAPIASTATSKKRATR
jgi:leucyl aminopeptidase